VAAAVLASTEALLLRDPSAAGDSAAVVRESSPTHASIRTGHQREAVAVVRAEHAAAHAQLESVRCVGQHPPSLSAPVPLRTTSSQAPPNSPACFNTSCPVGCRAAKSTPDSMRGFAHCRRCRRRAEAAESRIAQLEEELCAARLTSHTMRSAAA
jgi:hypothetical protein